MSLVVPFVLSKKTITSINNFVVIFIFLHFNYFSLENTHAKWNNNVPIWNIFTQKKIMI